MKTILWLTENYPPQRGGMAQSCDRIVAGLRNAGFTIHLFHFTNQVQKASKNQQNGSYQAVPFYDSEAHTINMAWNQIQTLKQCDCLACFGGYLSMIAAPIFSAWLDIPLFTFLRGNDFDTSIFTPRKRSVLEDALASSKKVFAVSSDKVDKTSKWLPEVEIVHTPNGINLEEWQPAESERRFAKTWKEKHVKDRTCLGLIGQLKPKKGSLFLLESLMKTNIKDQVHLLLIGDLEEGIHEVLLENEFSFTHKPFQDRYELLKYYLCCDALVIPSFYDGMPNVLLEAGGLGIPVIASDTGGMKDVISSGSDGLLFEAGDEESCRRALYRFLDMPDEDKSQLGVRLQQTITNSYTNSHEINIYSNHLI